MKAVLYTQAMKKDIAMVCPGHISGVLSRIARELRRIGARSADELATFVNLYLSAGCRFAPVVAFVSSLNKEESEENGESWRSSEHYVRKDETGVGFEDQYGACSGLRVINGNLELYFNTVGGHGLSIDIIGDSEIEVTADDLASERFWCDSDGDYLEEGGKASPQVVEDRESHFLKALAVDDQEFADREAEARLAQKADFERRITDRHVDTARRRAAAAAAKAAIEAKAKAAMAAAFADNDEV